MSSTTRAPVMEPEPISEDARGERPAVGGAISIERLEHSFGELSVIEGFDLEIDPGEVVGLVGPSGCGKSTLLELIAGLAEPRNGPISIGTSGPSAKKRSDLSLIHI